MYRFTSEDRLVFTMLVQEVNMLRPIIVLYLHMMRSGLQYAWYGIDEYLCETDYIITKRKKQTGGGLFFWVHR